MLAEAHHQVVEALEVGAAAEVDGGEGTPLKLWAQCVDDERQLRQC